MTDVTQDRDQAESALSAADEQLLRELTDRPRPQAVDQPVEGRPERLRHHLRRPPQRGTQVTTEEEVTPLS